MAISKKEATYQSGPKKGKLKAGYYYDLDGKLRKSKPVPRTKLYDQAKALGQQRAIKAGQKLRKKKPTRKGGRQKSLF